MMITEALCTIGTIIQANIGTIGTIGGITMILSNILSSVARMHPTRPALRVDGRSYSYADVYARADALAGALVARDVKPGDRVALLGPASPELFIAEFAAVALGAIPFGIFNKLTLPEIQSIVADADPAVLVYSPDMAPVAAKLAAPSLELRICCQQGGDHASLGLGHRSGQKGHLQSK